MVVVTWLPPWVNQISDRVRKLVYNAVAFKDLWSLTHAVEILALVLLVLFCISVDHVNTSKFSIITWAAGDMYIIGGAIHSWARLRSQ